MSRIYNVISPHLDDAALSCSLFLAANPGSCVTTIFANGPSSVRPLPPWDRAARYFADGADVMRLRREEDQRAAALVRATAVHMQYWDRQYRNEQYSYQGFEEKQLFDAVAEDLQRHGPDLTIDGLVIPLGLGHPDHRLAADVGLILAEHQPEQVFVYEELPYAVEDPADVADRKQRLVQHGFALEADETLEFLDDRALKKAVIRCHTSQRRQLRWRARRAIRTPERVWRLVRCR